MGTTQIPPRPKPAPSTIEIRAPSKYRKAGQPPPSPTSSPTTPTLRFLLRTWTVTHSTLSMWSKARNVRITYGELPAPATPAMGPLPPMRISDLVEHEALDGHGGLKSILGVDKSASPSDPGSWTWRGKGWLFWVTSHWEVLGWGERTLWRDSEEADRGGGDVSVDGAGGPGDRVMIGREKWVVTWFAPTLFTKEGVDIYCDRQEGLSEETAREIIAALKACDAKPVAEMVERDIKPVAINLPWKEKK